ncbi:MAG TPA: GAF domain-containing SpoIIE family protein phosphatase [Terriglobales bacterium]|nr:GAF domain-containing SpoIIE family protein phosphatase [Terriglobales bacterium]
MSTSPLTDFGFYSPPSPEPPTEKLAELVRLQKFAQRITSTLDIEELVPRIVDEVAASLGCVEINLYLRDPEQQEFVLAGGRGCTMYGKGHVLKPGAGMVGHVAATGKMHYAPDVSRDPYYVACEPATRSEVAIPLQREGDLVGVFTASHCELDAFCPDQLRLLQGLCAHVAVAVHNARRFGDEREQRERMSREAEEARSIQQALLPRSSPLIPGFCVSGLSIPAGSVGGDWYDFIPLRDGRWGLVLADVSGKGTAAALLMSATRGMLRSLAQTGSGPAEVLTRLNNMMIEDFPSGRFVTMVYAELDPSSRVLRIANAGHLSPLLVEPSGYRWINHEHGMPLGISASKFSETEVTLGELSRIAFYSDGITEAEIASGEEYGAERLLAQMQSPDVTPDSLLADVRKFTNGTGLRDDATVILVRARRTESESRPSD